MSEVVKQGERVQLRFPVERDRDSYLSLRRVSEAFLRPWEPLPPPGVDPYGSEAFDKVLVSASTERRRGLLVTTRADDEIVGAVNLNEICGGCFQSCYLGYWIGLPYIRQGFMTEALRLAVLYAFQDLGLHRIEANIIPGNVASIALVQRLGFRLEGLAERYLKIQGEWQDHERWAFTAEELVGA